MLYWVILYWYYIKAEYIYNTLTVSSEQSKILALGSSMTKNIAAFPAGFRFAVKLICCTLLYD